MAYDALVSQFATLIAATCLAAAVALAIGACRPPESPPSDPSPMAHGPSPNACESEDPLTHCDKGDPVVCRHDSDCQAPTCGPCTSGEIITHRDLGLACVVAECRPGDGGAFPAAVCSADHVCRIR